MYCLNDLETTRDKENKQRRTKNNRLKIFFPVKIFHRPPICTSVYALRIYNLYIIKHAETHIIYLLTLFNEYLHTTCIDISSTDSRTLGIKHTFII